MLIQVLVAMGQDRLFKEDAGEMLDQRVHMVTTTQDIRHSIRNFLSVDGNYLRDEGTLIRAMATRKCYIDRFEQQYDKVFTGNPFFSTYLVNHIHKQVQGFLHSYNITFLDNTKTGLLSKFRKIQRCVEWGRWVTSTPV